MGIRLMTNIPDDAVSWGIEDPVQCDRKLDGAERCAKMPAVAADNVDQLLPDLGGECGELGERQSLEVRGRRDAVEQWRRAPLRCRRLISWNHHCLAPRSAVRLNAGTRLSCRLACIAQG